MFSPSFSSHPPRKRTTSSSRPVTIRKVYGKRRTEAPRAALERDDVINSGPLLKSKRQSVDKKVDHTISTLEEDIAALTLGGGDDDDDDDDDSTNKREKGEDGGKCLEEELMQHSDSALDSAADAAALDGLALDSGKGQPMIAVQIIQPKEGNCDDDFETKLDNTEIASAKKEKSPKPKQAPRRSSGCIEDVKTNLYVRPVLREALSPLASRGVQKFESWARRAGDYFTVEKIAEGSYGEVYQMRLNEETTKNARISKSKLARLKAYDDGVFKIVPLRARHGVGSKKFTSIQEIVSEVQLLKLLDPIPGFARFREVHVVQGRFPEIYRNAWTKYKMTSDDCLNPDPSKKRSYPDTQLWAILEMDNAGYELEKFAWSSVFQVYDIFWGVALGLARAEQFASFEHRDLHLGNICIKSTANDRNPQEYFPTGGDALNPMTGFGLSGLETTIIDYSLSRAELQHVNVTDQDLVAIASSDLDKKRIFDAIGRDDDEKLLRDTYRYMRSQLYRNEPLNPVQLPNEQGIWEEYNPRTNLIWLLFILKMLLKKCEKPEVQAPPLDSRKPLGPRSANNKLSNKVSVGKNVPLKGKPAKQKPGNTPITATTTGEISAAVTSSTTASSLAMDLWDRLQTTLEMLDLEDGDETLYCAGDLVAFAIGAQWLKEGDFLC
ncbi:HASPIN protein kinase [Polytolypa hystricis UAMH7299]|uniref:non-specific serine/threonine protein kinase n=1 Tax=Polytolypa hystricis (strain UAMH7299) TaxID=1447883 RepID=A0A2B7YJ83_POLH7|nr:HASPIN protein kinase [Polytolypa hystricis UAMH7299]